MYNRGRSHVEYVGLAKHLESKALETVTFAMTRFTSSSYNQLQKIYCSYKALITAFIEIRENVEDEEEEAKYQVCGQDYAIDLCGALDVMKPAILLIIKSQALNLLPWKIVGWLPHVLDILEKAELELDNLQHGRIEIPNKELLPKLHKHWEELKDKEDEETTFFDMVLLDGWLVVDEEAVVVSPVRGRRREREVLYNWVARSPDDCLRDLQVLCQEMKNGLQVRYDNAVPQIIKDLAKCFDLESMISCLCAFRYEQGNLRIELEERRMWELVGDAEFANFFKHCLSTATCSAASSEMFEFGSPAA